MEPTELSMLELGKKLGSGELSSVEAVRACLARAERFDGQVKAFLTVDRDGALAQAEAADRRRRDGRRAGPLDGVPVGLKDLFLTEGCPPPRGRASSRTSSPPTTGRW
jgi:aspartyl-tRNA(Asn)/glutamyl-tRNA(Gln) amidotransferase subunit A